MRDIIGFYYGNHNIVSLHICVCVFPGEGGYITESTGGLGLGFTSAFLGLEGIQCCPNLILTYRQGQTNTHTPDQAVGQ